MGKNRLIPDTWLAQPWILPKELVGDNIYLRVVGDNAKLEVVGNNALITVTGNGVALRINNEAGGSVTFTVENNILVDVDSNSIIPRFPTGSTFPTYFVKKIEETEVTTAPTVLDKLYVYLPSTGIGVKYRLVLYAEVYNNAGQPTVLELKYKNSSAAISTVETQYSSCISFAEVTELGDDWLILQVSTLNGGTAYIRNACGLLVPFF